MEKKPYHHLPDGTFRNPEGSPMSRSSSGKFSYRDFNKEKKKLDMTVPKEHVINKQEVLNNLEKFKNDDYIAWIGHATYLIKLGNTTLITDPVFSKNAGPLIFGPKRFTEPALKLNEIPKTDVFLLTHNHYDHQDMSTIRRFPFKDAKDQLIEAFERQYLIDLLDRHEGNVSKAARAADMDRKSISRLMKKHGITRSSPSG